MDGWAAYLWKEKDLGFVVFLVLLGLGAGLFGGTHVLQHNGAVQENVATEGTIESTDVDRRVVENSDGPDDIEYRPVIRYQYTVDGSTYIQDNVFPGSFERWRDARSWAEGIAGDYAAGQSVEVRYNPRDHGDAYIRNDGWPGEWLVTFGYAVVLALGSGWLIREGFRRRRQRELMTDTPTEEAESLSMGPSEISGVARTGDREPLPAPFTDDDCVVADWRVEEYDDDDGDDGAWQTVGSGLDGMPFLVDDGTGRVLVEPNVDTLYEFDEGSETTVEVGVDESPPTPVRSFIDRSSDVDPVTGAGDGVGTSDGDRRYHQRIIEPDEDVYVFGTVQPREDATSTSNVGNLHIGPVQDGSAEEPIFMIANEPESELIAERRWALWRLPVGILAITGAFGLLAAVFGPPIGVELPVVSLQLGWLPTR
jgi:hypothetical protein